MNIVFVLFENVTQLDFTGPVQFLSRLPGAKVHVVSKDGAAVKTDCGFSILPRPGFAQCPQADVLCVPGGHGVRDAIADQVIVILCASKPTAPATSLACVQGRSSLAQRAYFKAKRQRAIGLIRTCFRFSAQCTSQRVSCVMAISSPLAA
jgi:cyclohexyl-isocyanide hydratase